MCLCRRSCSIARLGDKPRRKTIAWNANYICFQASDECSDTHSRKWNSTFQSQTRKRTPFQSRWLLIEATAEHAFAAVLARNEGSARLFWMLCLCLCRSSEALQLRNVCKYREHVAHPWGYVHGEESRLSFRSSVFVNGIVMWIRSEQLFQRYNWTVFLFSFAPQLSCPRSLVSMSTLTSRVREIASPLPRSLAAYQNTSSVEEESTPSHLSTPTSTTAFPPPSLFSHATLANASSLLSGLLVRGEINPNDVLKADIYSLGMMMFSLITGIPSVRAKRILSEKRKRAQLEQEVSASESQLIVCNAVQWMNLSISQFSLRLSNSLATIRNNMYGYKTKAYISSFLSSDILWFCSNRQKCLREYSAPLTVVWSHPFETEFPQFSWNGSWKGTEYNRIIHHDKQAMTRNFLK